MSGDFVCLPKNKDLKVHYFSNASVFIFVSDI